MLGKPGDLIESIQHYKDGAPDIPLGSLGIVKQIVYEDMYQVQWINRPQDSYVWSHERFRIITHGRNKL